MTGGLISALTPLSFLERSAIVYAESPAVVYGERTWTYREFADEVARRARALRGAGVRPGDRVAYLMPNVPEMLVAHYAVPLAGAVLVAVNTRLAAAEARAILDHSGATLLVVDAAFSSTVAPLVGSLATVRTIVEVADPLGPPTTDGVPGAVAFADLPVNGTGELVWSVEDEHTAISINYTSGTTGRPKGVVYTHRGAYLNALGGMHHSDHDAGSVYLWTLPMFHCNGWCTPWALVAAGGTQVCLREVRGDAVWGLIKRHGVTHLNGAPTVLTTILQSAAGHALGRELVVTTAGAPPSPTVILGMEDMGFRIVHVYGLTETYGPYTINEHQRSWESLPPERRAVLTARQGVGMVQVDRVRVVDRELKDVPADGVTMGEVVMRGNTVMKEYFRDPEATAEAFAGGWFHSGDLGVLHPDGYVELRDRAKDVIISGGENISTIEVEHAVAAHPDVLEVAVLGVPDERWGERPKAFVVPRPGRLPTEGELIAHVREHLAHYKAPREVEIVDELPKTSTGKVQKYELREREWSGETTRIRG
ncbi:AMP-binding protein [Pseudonocardia halophobica]|uniref:Acyl-CoA synthetase n=1 Tax=Pseudonocardia halophobica TaxID=29401 RepID=A0A9W6NYX9_9PSEU|nr:long-chain-fatty-acid--CoA ligase [Pseudonocardia halophobica]GLL14007.1 acyl-CoA synthetase [Pseudonocardia halophobica]